MKPPFWLRLDGPYTDDATGEVYMLARVRWFAWPFVIAIALWDMLKGDASGSR